MRVFAGWSCAHFSAPAPPRRRRLALLYKPCAFYANLTGFLPALLRFYPFLYFLLSHTLACSGLAGDNTFFFVAAPPAPSICFPVEPGTAGRGVVDTRCPPPLLVLPFSSWPGAGLRVSSPPPSFLLCPAPERAQDIGWTFVLAAATACHREHRGVRCCPTA